MKVVIVEMCI